MNNERMTTQVILNKLDTITNKDGDIRALFGLMGIAEQELADHGLFKAPGMFLLLQPPPGFTRLIPALYRSHAQELLARVKAGQDTSLGTDAEVLNAIMECATRSPLRSHIVQAAERLFHRCMPDEYRSVMPPMQERFPEEAEAFIEETRAAVGKLRTKP